MITRWLETNTPFGRASVRVMNLDWNKIALRYKEQLYYENKRAKQKAVMTNAFILRRKNTAAYKERQAKRKGQVCARLAAARAREDTESEIVLGLI